MRRKKSKKVKISCLTELPRKIFSLAREVGVDKESSRSGTFFQLDKSVIFSRVNELFKEKLEILSMKEALKKYDWLREKYYGLLIGGKRGKRTAKGRESFMNGYFLRILPNTNVELPLQACMFISKQGFKQRVRNLVIAEEGSNAKLITGCTLNVNPAQHFGITEFFIKRNATLNFTMIHGWGEDTKVRPMAVALVEDNASFVSNYICLKPARDLKMYPEAICQGENSRASFNNILYTKGNSLMNVGSKIRLEGAGSRGEVISRTVARDKSKVIVRGTLIGNNQSKAHLECKGILQDDADIHAIPELVANSKGAELSHEAAVGKIAEKEIIYLMSRGLTREEATSAIIRGFLDTSIMGLPRTLEREIKVMVDKTVGKL